MSVIHTNACSVWREQCDVSIIDVGTRGLKHDDLTKVCMAEEFEISFMVKRQREKTAYAYVYLSTAVISGGDRSKF